MSALAAAPHGTCSAQRATLVPGRARSANPVMCLGLPFPTAITSWFLAKLTGVPAALPASVTVFMLAGAAEAKTSAGAPWLICVASAELPAKLNVTVAPGPGGWRAVRRWRVGGASGPAGPPPTPQPPRPARGPRRARAGGGRPPADPGPAAPAPPPPKPRREPSVGQPEDHTSNLH